MGRSRDRPVDGGRHVTWRDGTDVLAMRQLTSLAPPSTVPTPARVLLLGKPLVSRPEPGREATASPRAPCGKACNPDPLARTPSRRQALWTLWAAPSNPIIATAPSIRIHNAPGALPTPLLLLPHPIKLFRPTRIRRQALWTLRAAPRNPIIATAPSIRIHSAGPVLSTIPSKNIRLFNCLSSAI